ncbi:MAG: exo-alpha-sialidase [Pirellulales bacterium]|nr:exo-alpha-sialidase [Pirellulales bacterium]
MHTTKKLTSCGLLICAVLLSLIQIATAKDAPSAKDLAPKGSSGGKVTSNGYWIPDCAVELKGIKPGKYLHMDGGELLCISGNAAFSSSDRGKTWKKLSTILKDTEHMALGVGRDILRTKKGTIIIPFSNGKEKKWTWTSKLHDAPGAKLPTFVVRSTDGGKTWLEPQKLHDDWTGDNSGIIQTDKGSIIMTSMKLLHNPGRHAVITYRSTDEGENWTPSHVLDLGGAGHHDGTKEAAILMQNGRPWMLIRTNWNVFWNAFSDDDGKSWRTLYASDIDASSAPGFLRRLKDGRIALVWNRLRPQNDPDFKFVHWPDYHEAPASWHRDELSFAVSSDEGKTWSKSLVVARKPKGNVSYPYMFEIEPGKLWVATYGGLHIELDVSKCVGE